MTGGKNSAKIILFMNYLGMVAKWKLFELQRRLCTRKG